MRPKRFSSPSIYFALQPVSHKPPKTPCPKVSAEEEETYPFGGLLFFSTCVKTHSVL